MGRIVKAFTPLKPSMARGRMLPSRKGFLAVKAKNDLILIIFFRGRQYTGPQVARKVSSEFTTFI
jgi:hypothetical protein